MPPNPVSLSVASLKRAADPAVTLPDVNKWCGKQKRVPSLAQLDLPPTQGLDVTQVHSCINLSPAADRGGQKHKASEDHLSDSE